MLPDPILATLRRLSLDSHQRLAAARLLRVQAWGERIAMEGARAQAAIAPTREARRFLLRQSRQEAFHARLFARLSQALAKSVGSQRVSHRVSHRASEFDDPLDDEIPAPLARVRDVLFNAIARRDYTEAVVIQHVALEGLGIAVLKLLDDELASFGNRFGRFRRLVLAQEDAHFAFGAQILVSHGPDNRLARLTRQMLDEAECLLVSMAPQFQILGGEVDDVIGPLRAGALVSTRAMQS